MGKLHNVVHNALRSWAGPTGGYESDTSSLEEGVYPLPSLKNLYDILKQYAGEEGIEGIKGRVIVKEICVCEGKKHYKGKEYLLKVVVGNNVIFARLRVTFHYSEKKVELDTL